MSHPVTLARFPIRHGTLLKSIESDRVSSRGLCGSTRRELAGLKYDIGAGGKLDRGHRFSSFLNPALGVPRLGRGFFWRCPADRYQVKSPAHRATTGGAATLHLADALTGCHHNNDVGGVSSVPLATGKLALPVIPIGGTEHRDDGVPQSLHGIF